MRVLHLEDDPGDALLVQRTMQQSGLPLEIIHAPNATGYLSAVESGGIDRSFPIIVVCPALVAERLLR